MTLGPSDCKASDPAHRSYPKLFFLLVLQGFEDCLVFDELMNQFQNDICEYMFLSRKTRFPRSLNENCCCKSHSSLLALFSNAPSSHPPCHPEKHSCSDGLLKPRELVTENPHQAGASSCWDSKLPPILLHGTPISTAGRESREFQVPFVTRICVSLR